MNKTIRHIAFQKVWIYCRFIPFLWMAFLFACKKNSREVISYPQFDTIFHKVDSMYSIMRADQSLNYLDSAFKAQPHAGVKDLYRWYAFKSHYYSDHHLFSEAMPYADSMLWTIRNYTGNKAFIKEYGNALFTKGYLFLSQKQYAEAFENYNRARHIINETGDSCLMGDYTFMLSLVSNKRGKYLEAAHYAIQGVEEVSHCPENYRLFRLTQSLLDDIGIFYTRSDMPDSGLHYFRQALEYIDREAHQYLHIPESKIFVATARGVIYGNMGDAYYKQGHIDTAEMLYQQSISINKHQYYDLRDAEITQAKLANLYLSTSRMSQAREVLDQLKETLQLHPNKETELKWYGLQWDYYEKLGQVSQAYPYIKPYLRLKDSLDRSNQIPQVDINLEYEHIRDQYNLALLEKKEELTLHYLIAAGTLALLAGAFTLLLWNNWRRTRRLNAQISNKNEEMQLAMSSLLESQKENTRIMKIVAHDLRSPIASSISVARVLLENDNLAEDDKEMLELMQTSGEQSIEMIADLLSMNATAEEMKKESVALHTLLRYCVDLMQFQAQAKRQTITLDTQEITVEINSEKIWRVVSNLIVNAIKFSPEEAHIFIRLYQQKDKVLICVQDQGIGIPDHLKDKIFNMFTDAKRPGTQGEQSYGIGLSIAKQIIEAHHGRIWFESNAGKGTTFYIALPVSA